MAWKMLRLAALVTLVAGALVAPATGTTHQPILCGRVVARGVGYSVTLERGHVRCRTARRVMRAYLTAPRRRCQGSHCYIRIRGWDCIGGSLDEPFAAECSRGRRLVRAYQADV